MMTPMERRLHHATVKAIKKAKANGTYKPPTPYPYAEIGHSELYAYKTRNRDYK